MILCEICNTKFRCINGEFICENGHISATKLELADDLQFSFKSQKQRTKKEDNAFANFSFTYKNLVFYNLLFSDLVSFLKCSSTKFIDFYTNFFEGDRNLVKLPLKVSFGYLIVLGYFTKRTELEKKGDTFLYTKYLLEIQNFDYIGKSINIKKLLDMKKVKNSKLGIKKNNFCWINKYKIIDILGTANYPINKKHRKILEETSLSHPLIEYNKAVIRQEFDYSLDLILRYFYKVLEIYTIKPTESLIHFLKKYIELRNLSNKMFVPEDEISMYLFLYDKHFKLEIDYKTAIKNVNLFLENKYFDETQSDPEKISFVDLITLLSHTSHYFFYNRLISVISAKEFKGTNPIFVVHKTRVQYYRAIKWKSFRVYIRRLKKLLESKMNYKTKRTYIEDDRI